MLILIITLINCVIALFVEFFDWTIPVYCVALSSETMERKLILPFLPKWFLFFGVFIAASILMVAALDWVFWVSLFHYYAIHHLPGTAGTNPWKSSHRKKCSKCLAFRERYCNYRPCWLCEWTWCDMHEQLCKDRLTGKCSSGDQISTQTEERKFIHKVLNIPFLEEKQDNEKSQQVLRLLAAIYLKDANGDFLLCSSHLGDLKKITAEEAEEPIGCGDIVLAGVGIRIVTSDGKREIELFSSGLPFRINADNLDVSMHTFLRELYSEKFLNAKLVYQLFYKSKFYDLGVRDGSDQDDYWRQVKTIKKEHSSCGERCALRNASLNKNGIRSVPLKPNRDGNPHIMIKLDQSAASESIVMDAEEIKFFVDVTLLSSNTDNLLNVARECPSLSETRTDPETLEHVSDLSDLSFFY
ncbi:uncharacterized protein LOC129601485 [Paramacrobiotus metropolitanus]|uniref:uncharacterized protein LOC129601485 n=1 Tax=Paramacrobiotus metropolitanus TaxID=2943436 RepID=UPI002445AB0F|nr:uncharacterized protein LOC129601485 [Paramacrobiotus metropolitanus]XP_055356286.1 uncharacterized protein LOC129601485 [Paramacrobiotus metropolitanus]XP_055356287.1 uncharacterized protein LOC129601485 [Paramacrobiotus metropolitanus]